jgi:hypothetical protein
MTLMCIKPLDISAALMPLDRSPDDAAASGVLIVADSRRERRAARRLPIESERNLIAQSVIFRLAAPMAPLHGDSRPDPDAPDRSDLRLSAGHSP